MAPVRPGEPLGAETFRQHALNEILPHWYEHSLDREFGGYIPQLDRRWRITDPDRKHLVPTARLIYNFCQGHLLDGPDWCGEAARAGLDFLLRHFRDDEHGGWLWQVDRRGRPRDPDKYTYGHAFAILALSEFHRAFGDERAADAARKTFDVLEAHAYDPAHGGYRSRFSRDWSDPEEMRSSRQSSLREEAKGPSAAERGRDSQEGLSPMRSQNPQMHLVEALLALYEVTDEERYLDRAAELCRLMNDRLFDHAHGCLPEFFHDDWSDFPEYQGDPVEPGHQMEWAWLLLRVHAYRPEDAFLERAGQMVAFAWEHGWDREFGGLYTTLSRTGEVRNPRKSFWQQCEGVMAPLWLWGHTGEEEHRSVFEQAARYCFEHFVDREFGGWFGGLSRENRPTGEHKGGAWKADYHPVQMCAEVCRFLSGGAAGR